MNNLLTAILLSLSASFGLFSMYKNDAIVTNRFLYQQGWFFFAGITSSAIYYFVCFAVSVSLITSHSIADFISTAIFHPLVAYVFAAGYIYFALYLFSLSRKCMQAKYLPRTARIFVKKRWRRFIILLKNFYKP